MLNSNLRGMHAPKPKLSKWAYTGVVRPKLLYACMTWGNSINTLQQIKKAKSLRQTSSKINHYNNKEYPTGKGRNHDRSNVHRANDIKKQISQHTSC